jgi:hypothetical protein
MQLNVYVPKKKAGLVEELDRTAKRTGRAKNELVLEALERFLGEEKPAWRTFHLGGAPFPPREELYEDYLDHKMGLDDPGR